MYGDDKSRDVGGINSYNVYNKEMMIREMEVEMSGQARTFLQWEDTVPGETFLHLSLGQLNIAKHIFSWNLIISEFKHCRT